MTPFPGENLAWVLLSGILISDFLHSSGAVQVAREAMGPVLRGDLLLVTNAVGASIEKLRRIQLGKGANSIRLDQLWPVESFSRYQSQRSTKPRVLVANVGWVTHGIEGRKIGAVIVDGMHPRTWMHTPSVLEGMKSVPIQVIVAPPLGERDLAVLGYPKDASAWLWDPAAQEIVAEFIIEKDVACRDVTERLLWVCDDPVVDKCMAEVHELLGLSQRESQKEFPPLWSAWAIYHRLRQLAVPLSQLEDSAAYVWGAIPIRKRLVRLKESWPQEVAIEARWKAILDGLEKAYQLLQERQEPQKFWGVAERVQANLDGGHVLRVVVPSEREVALLSMQLGYIVDSWFDALHEDRVEVVSGKGEARCLAREEGKRTLLLGFRAGMLRHLDLYPCHTTEVLAYPYELDVDEAVQGHMYRFAETLQQDSFRCGVLESIGFQAFSGGECRISPRPKVTIAGEVKNRVSKVRKPLVDPTYLDLKRLSDSGIPQDWGEDIEDEREARDGQHQDGGKRIEVVFYDGACVGYWDWQRVDVYHPGTEQIERHEVSKLLAGMRVVGMVDGVYERLYDRVLESLHAKESPYYTATLALWEIAKVDALRRHGGNKTELFRELVSKGLQVDYGAVVQWYRGGELENLAPQKYEDMKLIAEQSGKYPNDKLIRSTWSVIRRERVRRRKAGKALHALLRAIVQGDGYEKAIRAARELGNEIGEMFAAVEVREVVSTREIA
ncbi:MAG: hypothetical protein JW836_14590 [Deltaproteobacteria bacterium]|nr:hypothetical protein [Deltaproteobacteria bacterium]